MFNIIFKNIFYEISKYLQKNQNFEILSEVNSSNDNISFIDKKCEEIFIKYLCNNTLNIVGYISEETEDITFFYNVNVNNNEDYYIVAFDPLDGSKNYNSNINTGSIYGIYRYDKKNNKLIEMVESGYCLYGIKSIMVYTNKNNVLAYDITNDIQLKNIKFTNDKSSKIYSINQSNEYNPEIKFLLQQYKKNNYNMRWTGTLVADAHRILVNDGIFYYPTTEDKPTGKIRMLYEALPFTYIFKVAGGVGVDESFNDLLNKIQLINLKKIHYRTSIILASKMEFNQLLNLLEYNELNKH